MLGSVDNRFRATQGCWVKPSSACRTSRSSWRHWSSVVARCTHRAFARDPPTRRLGAGSRGCRGRRDIRPAPSRRRWPSSGSRGKVRLAHVALRADVGDLGDTGRRGAVAAMAGIAGRRRGIAALQQRRGVHAGGPVGERRGLAPERLHARRHRHGTSRTFSRRSAARPANADRGRARRRARRGSPSRSRPESRPCHVPAVRARQVLRELVDPDLRIELAHVRGVAVAFARTSAAICARAIA